MQPVPIKWTFRTKQLDDSGERYLLKALCVLRGDLKQPYEDIKPENIYAPVASHESFR